MIITGSLAHGIVLPGVPRPRSDTWLLARAALAEPLCEQPRILELCAGPAFAGIAAARGHQGHLTTVDRSRRAARNARLNAPLNGVRIDARHGDLFAAVTDGEFDLILANAPDDVGRITAAAPAHLAPGGTLLLIHSAVCGTHTTLGAYTGGGLLADIAAGGRGVLRARRETDGQASEALVVTRAV